MTHARHSQLQNRWSILTTVTLTMSALALLLSPAVVFAESGDQLTTEDKKLLAKGELVMKQKNEQRGAYKLFGGQSWQIIDVPIDVAWDALKNLPDYKNFIPLATETDVQHQAGDEADVAVRQQWGPIDVRYVLQTTVEKDRSAVVFRVDHSKDHDIRAGWGFIRVRPYKQNRTLVSFGALVDIGDGVFVSIVRPAVRRDLLKIPYYLKQHLEGHTVAATTTKTVTP